MFQKPPSTDGAGKGSVFYRGVSGLGTAIGIGVSILATPPIFDRTRGPLFAYLTKTWGDNLSNLLTWTMGGVEGFILYASVKLIFTSLVIFAFAALAARRFPTG
jgi:hypothetical protein